MHVEFDLKTKSSDFNTTLTGVNSLIHNEEKKWIGTLHSNTLNLNPIRIGTKTDPAIPRTFWCQFAIATEVKEKVYLRVNLRIIHFSQREKSVY